MFVLAVPVHCTANMKRTKLFTLLMLCVVAM